MGKNKKVTYSHREEEKAKRLIIRLCVGLVVLAILTIIGYSML
ncbi:MAG: hypothetical protein U0L16_00855 [Phocaeicola sp.]|nr:hypothetical protein [Phocaeicola sp.]